MVYQFDEYTQPNSTAGASRLSFLKSLSRYECLVSLLFLPEITQQIHSLRANGVMSSHTACAFGTEAIAFSQICR
jgi:hypothetical protein